MTTIDKLLDKFGGCLTWLGRKTPANLRFYHYPHSKRNAYIHSWYLSGNIEKVSRNVVGFSLFDVILKFFGLREVCYREAWVSKWEKINK